MRTKDIGEIVNVLSLFDGISCGQMALERAGIKVDNYYASEVDKYAIQITQKNYPSTIQLGDVREVKGKDLPPIDLLIGGSPCQGFSFAGKQLNFEDPRSKLYFEFVRLVSECNPEYFLLENVKMKREYQDIISEHLSIDPVEINSALVSAQNRKRLYWTNIPNIEQPEDKGILFKDLIAWSRSTRYPKEEDSYVEQRARYDGKSNTLVTGSGCSSFSSRNFIFEEMNHTDKALEYMNREVKGGRTHWDFGYTQDLSKNKGKCITANIHKGIPYNVLVDKVPTDKTRPIIFRKLHPTECEALQTIDTNYTEGVSNTQRYKMLGNCWTVDVIVHILKHIDMPHYGDIF